MLPHLHVGLPDHGLRVAWVALENQIEDFGGAGIIFHPGGDPADLVLIIQIVGVQLEQPLVDFAGLRELLLANEFAGGLLLVLREDGCGQEHTPEDDPGEPPPHAFFPSSLFMRAISSMGLNGLIT